MTKQRKKTQSITDTIAQHLETTDPETVVISEVTEEKSQPALNEEPKETVEKEEEKVEMKKEETLREEPKEKIIVSPHHKDSDTSAINFGLNSIF